MRAKRLAFCRRCNGETPQTFLSTDRPGVELWRCRCDAVLMSIADIPDADGFAISVAESWIRRQSIVVSAFDREDIHGEARISLWKAYLRWDPARGLPFRSYAAWKTASLLTDWIREQRGRTYGDDHSGLKAHAVAVSLDTPDSDGNVGTARLDGIVAEGVSDPATDRSPDLARALELRGGRVARPERDKGVPTYAGAT